MKFKTRQTAKKLCSHSKKAFSNFTLTLLLLSSFLAFNQNAEAQQLVCPSNVIEQITDETAGDSGDSSINADGTRIAFDSKANINGGNPDGNFQVYLFDTTTGVITQITDEPGFLDSVSPSINADGTRIAFASEADINGGNPGGNSQIYLFDTTTGVITQITDEMAGNSFFPSINADGTRIAFFSSSNISGGNPDGIFQVFLFNTTTGIFTQVTDETAGVSDSPSINADGTRIAFTSEADINGENPGGVPRIYLFDTATGIITQITDGTTEGSFSSSINADGTRIAFQSFANINGGNPGGNSQIYLFDMATGIITQITDETTGDSFEPSINSDGTRISFESFANINGGNPDGNREIYLFDTIIGVFIQITDETMGDSQLSSINAAGTRIVFQSTSNINGGNPGGVSQIYLAICFNSTNSNCTLAGNGATGGGLAGLLLYALIPGAVVVRRRLRRKWYSK